MDSRLRGSDGLRTFYAFIKEKASSLHQKLLLYCIVVLLFLNVRKIRGVEVGEKTRWRRPHDADLRG
jgi:hypothetical protein